MFYFYNNFELNGLISQYYSIRWVRNYNDIGEFEIELPFDKDIFENINVNTVILNTNINEAGIVLNKTVMSDNEGNWILNIKGENISTLLKRRIASYVGKDTIGNIIQKLLNENFISPTNNKRKINGFKLGNITISNSEIISIEYENEDVYSILSEILQKYNIGFKVTFDINNKGYIFDLFEGENKDYVVFSYDYNNILEQEYFSDISDFKNTCIMDNDGTLTVVNDENVGIDRFETYSTVKSDDTATIEEQGKLFLQKYKLKENLETVIDTSAQQFIYLEDWNLGDIITTVNKRLNITLKKNILKIEEFYDESGKNITVTFGDL